MITVRRSLPSVVLALLPALLAGTGLACGGGDPAPAKTTTPAPRGPAAAAPGARPDSGAATGTAGAQLAYQNGLQLLLKGEPEQARDQLQLATKLDPRMSEAFYELGKLEVHLSAKIIGSQARDLDVIEKGLAALQKACELEPANDDYWYWLGRSYKLDAEDPQALAKATAALEKAVQLNPKHALAWKSLGLRQKEAGDFEKAGASLERSIETDPTDAGAFFQLGQTFESRQRLEEAREAYRKSIAIDPTSASALSRLTQVCAQLDDAAGEAEAKAASERWKGYNEKLLRRRQAINQNPNDAAALRRLGEMYFEVGNWEESLEWFLRAIHIDPKDPLSHLYCGVARRHLRDYTNALNHLKEAEYLAEDYLDPKLELLRLYAETKDDTSLGELAASVEKAAQEDGESLYALAEVLQEIGRTEDATRVFARAKALGVTQATLKPPAAEDEGAQAGG